MVKPKLSDLTLREKISQTALARQGVFLQDFKTLDELKEYLRKNPCGGLWVQGVSNVGDINMADDVAEGFSEKNYSNKYAKWIEELDSSLKIPIIAATDAETGGNFTFPEMTLTSTAAGLGAADSSELAFETGKCIATELKYAGVNWIWGPVVDLSNRFAGVLINRAYGDRKELNARLAKAQIEGMQGCGIASAIKHFPGTGKTEYRDSHASITTNFESLKEWEQEQGAIFQTAIDAGVWSVMVGHVGFPAVDNRKVYGGYMPSTLSYNVITKLLKEKMGFKGVVITDGIGMKGIKLMYDRPKLYIELLKAGNDMILGPAFIDEYLEVVENAVKSGDLSEERIDDACQRVLNLKEKAGLFENKNRNMGFIPGSVLNATAELNHKVAQRSVTLVCDGNNIIPLSQNKIKKVVAIYLGYLNSHCQALEKVLTKEFAKRGATFKMQRFLDDSRTHDEWESGEKIAEENDLIIYLPDLPLGSCNMFSGETWRTVVFSLMHGREKSVVLAVNSPFVYYDYFTTAKTFLCTFGVNDKNIEAAIAGLYGEMKFTGKMPVELIPDHAKGR